LYLNSSIVLDHHASGLCHSTVEQDLGDEDLGHGRPGGCRLLCMGTRLLSGHEI